MFAGMQQPPQFNMGGSGMQQPQQPMNNGGFGGFQTAPQMNTGGGPAGGGGSYYGGLVNLAPSGQAGKCKLSSDASELLCEGGAQQVNQPQKQGQQANFNNLVNW